MKEKVIQTIAWWLPRRLVYWCAVRFMVNATQGPWSNQIVPDLKAADALERWDKPKEVMKEC